MRLVAIVEGDGEAKALPLLVRRIALSLERPEIEILPPIRLPRTRLLKRGELEQAVELAARFGGPAGSILVLLDADRDCPAELGPAPLARARGARPDRRIGLVLAKREYEAWFIAAAASLAGKRTLQVDLVPPAQPEEINGAKEWLSRRMASGRSYRETIDQPALTQLFDLEAARAAPSFDKLWRCVRELLDPVMDRPT